MSWQSPSLRLALRQTLQCCSGGESLVTSINSTDVVIKTGLPCQLAETSILQAILTFAIDFSFNNFVNKCNERLVDEVPPHHTKRSVCLLQGANRKLKSMGSFSRTKLHAAQTTFFSANRIFLLLP